TRTTSRDDLLSIAEIQVGLQWHSPYYQVYQPFFTVAMEGQIWNGAGNATSEQGTPGSFGFTSGAGLKWETARGGKPRGEADGRWSKDLCRNKLGGRVGGHASVPPFSFFPPEGLAMAIKRRGSAVWQGGLKDGQGTIST